MDLTLNKLQSFICHKKPTNQPTSLTISYDNNHYAIVSPSVHFRLSNMQLMSNVKNHTKKFLLLGWQYNEYNFTVHQRI